MATPLPLFPLELLKLIAIFLPTVRDILSFASVSHRLNAAVHSDQLVFRTLFLRTFEPPRAATGTYDYKAAFQTRYKALRKPKPDEAVLLDLINDSRPRRKIPSSRVISLNLSHLRPGVVTTAVPALRLLIFPITVNFNLTPLTESSVAELQNSAYTITTLRSLSAAATADVNLLFPIAALFIDHLCPTSEEDVSYQASHVIRQSVWLALYEFPSLWENARLEELASVNSKMSTRWIGAYTFLDFPHQVGQEPYALYDVSSDNSLADMTLSWELPPASEDRRGFTGLGKDFGSFTLQDGFITPLPDAGGVGGWKYVSYLKNYVSHRWAYNGIMLPGNNMVFGVWRDPDLPLHEAHTSQYGIFMMWAAPPRPPGLAGRELSSIH